MKYLVLAIISGLALSKLEDLQKTDPQLGIILSLSLGLSYLIYVIAAVRK
jgi:hypothetical protein